jgi:hypothetical protein
MLSKTQPHAPLPGLVNEAEISSTPRLSKFSLQPFCKPPHLSMHIGHRRSERGVQLGSKAVHKPCKTGEAKKLRPHLKIFHSKRTRQPPLKFEPYH